MNRHRYAGPLCPADPAHGPLLADRATQADGRGWYCPHQAHDGAPPKDGRARIPPTRNRFSTKELTP